MTEIHSIWIVLSFKTECMVLSIDGSGLRRGDDLGNIVHCVKLHTRLICADSQCAARHGVISKSRLAVSPFAYAEVVIVSTESNQLRIRGDKAVANASAVGKIKISTFYWAYFTCRSTGFVVGSKEIAVQTDYLVVYYAAVMSPEIKIAVISYGNGGVLSGGKVIVQYKLMILSEGVSQIKGKRAGISAAPIIKVAQSYPGFVLTGAGIHIVKNKCRIISTAAVHGVPISAFFKLVCLTVNSKTASDYSVGISSDNNGAGHSVGRVFIYGVLAQYHIS